MTSCPIWNVTHECAAYGIAWLSENRSGGGWPPRWVSPVADVLLSRCLSETPPPALLAETAPDELASSRRARGTSTDGLRPGLQGLHHPIKVVIPIYDEREGQDNGRGRHCPRDCGMAGRDRTGGYVSEVD
jgi:hypothetical protein